MGVFATRYFKSPCDGIGGAVKQHVAKRSLQRFLNNQILDYKAMLDLCENEIMSIQLFEISKESMISVQNLKKWDEGWGHCTCYTEKLPFRSIAILAITGHKLTSKAESYADIYDLNVPTLFQIRDISPSAYVTWIYNSFWWVGVVSSAVITASDVINTDLMHPHEPRKTAN